MSEEENPNENKSIDGTEKGINTEEIPQEGLEKLDDNNKENQDSSKNELDSKEKESGEKENNEDLINEIIKKQKYYNMLNNYNNELKNKIDISNKRYKEVLEKIEEKKNEDSEGKLTNQIREMEKEINANNVETERYKRMIDKLKNKIEFKSNLERAFNLQNLLKKETNKNNELKKQYNNLISLNEGQIKFIDEYDKENQITEKIEILKNEIKESKICIKDYAEKFIKQDRFIRIIHEKILTLEMMIKKLKEPKVKQKENNKSFTKEELKDTLQLIYTLKEQIKDCRIQLNNMTKTNDEKIHQLLSQNKQIEIDYTNAEKENKNLIFKKNELKRKIKNLNVSMGKGKVKRYYLKGSIINMDQTNNNNNSNINEKNETDENENKENENNENKENENKENENENNENKENENEENENKENENEENENENEENENKENEKEEN